MLKVNIGMRLGGAFILEERHLRRLDEIIQQAAIEDKRQSVSVGLERSRSFQAENFSSLATVSEYPVLDRLSIVSLDGEAKGAQGYFSVAFYKSGIITQAISPMRELMLFSKPWMIWQKMPERLIFGYLTPNENGFCKWLLWPCYCR